METNETKSKEELILQYASLASKNLRENGSPEPTEEMKNISKLLQLSHSEIILSAEQLTRSKIK
jgi:hypothetical protein